MLTGRLREGGEARRPFAGTFQKRKGTWTGPTECENDIVANERHVQTAIKRNTEAAGATGGRQFKTRTG